MPKPSEADKERFRALVPDDPRVEIKPMFGNLGAFVNGNMFMGLLGDRVGLKLDDDALDEVRAMEGAGDFGPGEGPMRGWVALPPALADDPDRAGDLVNAALTHIAALPPKKPKNQ